MKQTIRATNEKVKDRLYYLNFEGLQGNSKGYLEQSDQMGQQLNKSTTEQCVPKARVQSSVP